MTCTHTIHQRHHHFGWDNAQEPALSVRPGETVSIGALDASGRVRTTRFEDGSLFGIADTHAHVLSNLAFGGGGIFHGAPFHPLGVEHALEEALRAEIEALRAGEIGAEELARVKTNVRASDVFQRDSMFYQAMRIGRLETTGVGQDAYAAYQAGIERVTAEDVQEVARRYLTDRRLTVAELVPEGVDGDGNRRRGGDGPLEGEDRVVQ